jgi:rod shape-determining protein MreD
MDRTGAVMGGRIVASMVPVTLALIGVIAENFPVRLLGGLVPAPLLGLMPVYYWCLVRPDLMTPAWAFVIGFLEDLLSGGPPGMWTASFVVTYAVIDRQRDAFAGLAGFGAVLGFGAAGLVACGVSYFIFGISYWHLPPLAPWMVELATTVAFYIPIASLFGAVHHRLVGPLRSDI